MINPYTIGLYIFGQHTRHISNTMTWKKKKSFIHLGIFFKAQKTDVTFSVYFPPIHMQGSEKCKNQWVL